MAAVTAHALYENFVLEAKLNELLNTKLALRPLMTIDTSLTLAEGMKKTINKYDFTTDIVEKVAKGAKNTKKGFVTMTPVHYDVVVSQATMEYKDEDYMIDNKVLDYGMEGMATAMVNDFNTSYFTEAAKATLTSTIAATEKVYDGIVDAIEKMNLEDESGLYIVIGNDLKARIRKEEDFKAVQLGQESVVFSGQIGRISGVPVVVSKLCPAGKIILATKEAITLFVKKETYVETDRDIEARNNVIVSGKVNVCALTDATKIVYVTCTPKTP